MKASKRTSARERYRRQKIINRAILVSTLVIIVVVTAYAFSRSNGVALPDYLNKCVPLQGKLAYTSSFQLEILINGANVTIPGQIGISGTCIRPLYTLIQKVGAVTVYVASDVNRTYTLGDFFTVWGNSYGPLYANFNVNQILSYHADSTHLVTLRIYNQTSVLYQNYPLPTGGNSQTNPLIQITYG